MVLWMAMKTTETLSCLESACRLFAPFRDVKQPFRWPIKAPEVNPLEEVVFFHYLPEKSQPGIQGELV